MNLGEIGKLGGGDWEIGRLPQGGASLENWETGRLVSGKLVSGCGLQVQVGFI
jgi:hypothetical protein